MKVLTPLPHATSARNQKLVDAGKPKKVAIVACMRKLLVTINTMLKTDTTWTPKTAAMSA